MINLVTGIDDIGTMGAKSEGWTFFSFREELLDNFNGQANEIIGESGLKSFHGKDFKRKKVEYYKRFLKLIRTTLKKKDNSFICCTLSDESWKRSFDIFCSNVIRGSFKNAGIRDEKFIESVVKLSSPIFTYMRKAGEYLTADFTSIDIDSDTILNRITSTEIITDEHRISPQVPIFAAFNAYRKKVFPNAPEISRESIKIINDEDSFMIQAADIFGNFSTALVSRRLGKDSKTNNLKADAFCEIFGDLIKNAKESQNVELKDDELMLKNSGAFNFCIAPSELENRWKTGGCVKKTWDGA